MASTQGRLNVLPMSPTQVARGGDMEIMLRCGAGLDVHKDGVEVCVRTIGEDGKLHQRFVTGVR